MQEYWIKQVATKPAFPDILWSRPENKQSAGKLLIIGGNLHSFIAVGQAYQAASVAGAGTVKVLLPAALRRTVGGTLENCEYANSNISGSFARSSLAELLLQSDWADAVLLAGDFGRNSETATVLEAFVQKYKGQLIITHDAIDYFFAEPKFILDRDNTCIVGSTAQIQKLATGAHYNQAITTSMDLARLVSVLHDFAKEHSAHLITHQLGTTIVVSENKVSSTKTGSGEDIWRVSTAATASVFWMQNFEKPFESITTSLVV